MKPPKSTDTVIVGIVMIILLVLMIMVTGHTAGPVTTVVNRCLAPHLIQLALPIPVLVGAAAATVHVQPEPPMVFVAAAGALLDICVATVAHGGAKVAVAAVLTLVPVVELFLRLVVTLLTPDPVMLPL